LPHAEFGSSARLRVGQLVVAIGNPLGFFVRQGLDMARGTRRSRRAEGPLCIGRFADHGVEATANYQPFSAIGAVCSVVDVIRNQLVEFFAISGCEIAPVPEDHVLRPDHQVKAIVLAHQHSEKIENVTRLCHARRSASVS
jgi:hypothetical protein